MASDELDLDDIFDGPAPTPAKKPAEVVEVPSDEELTAETDMDLEVDDLFDEPPPRKPKPSHTATPAASPEAPAVSAGGTSSTSQAPPPTGTSSSPTAPVAKAPSPDDIPLSAKKAQALGGAQAPGAPASGESRTRLSTHDDQIQVTNPEQRSRPLVLLCDPDTVLRDELAKSLVALEADVLTSGSIETGWIMAKRYHPDLILMDAFLEQNQGFKLMQNLKRDTQTQDIDIVVCSKQRTKELVIMCARLKVGDMFAKPFLAPEAAERIVHRLKRDNQEVKMTSLDSLRGRTFLIVDDDPKNRYSLALALESMDVNVVQARDGRAALPALRDNPHVDLVLMDLQMPDVDGVEATRMIKADPQFASMPVIAVTANPDMYGAAQAVGMEACVSKPVDLRILVDVLKKRVEQ